MIAFASALRQALSLVCACLGLASFLSLPARAQAPGEPLRVPVQFAARAWYPNPDDPGQTYGTVLINLAGKTAQTTDSSVPVNSPVRTVYLEPGKEYTGSHQMLFSRPWEGGFFAAPPGYAIYINGEKANRSRHQRTD
jgi:hypothetical protein